MTKRSPLAYQKIETDGDYRMSAVNAALANGTLGHGEEIDESLEEIGHASAVIAPT